MQNQTNLNMEIFNVFNETVLVRVTQAAPESAAGLQSQLHEHSTLIKACDTAEPRTSTTYCGEECSADKFTLSPYVSDTPDRDAILFTQCEIVLNWKRGRLLGAGAFGLVHVVKFLDGLEQTPPMAVKAMAIQETS